MATSRLPVPIPENTWVDLYAETGITIGVQLMVQNIGSAKAFLVESSLQPVGEYGFNEITPKEYLTNIPQNIGAWAFSNTGTTLQVEEA
jgi:hypothetical protein